VAGLLGHGASELRHLHARIIQKMVDSRIISHTSTNLGQYRRGDSHERSPFVRKAQDCRGPLGKHSAPGLIGERIHRLGVED
jgi:hypothetical protein